MWQLIDALGSEWMCVTVELVWAWGNVKKTWQSVMVSGICDELLGLVSGVCDVASLIGTFGAVLAIVNGVQLWLNVCEAGHSLDVGRLEAEEWLERIEGFGGMERGFHGE